MHAVWLYCRAKMMFSERREVKLSLIHSANVMVGKEKVCLRLFLKGRALLLERELVQADGSTFVHSMLLDNESILFEYAAADPYFRQLEMHYSAIQGKVSSREQWG